MLLSNPHRRVQARSAEKVTYMYEEQQNYAKMSVERPEVPEEELQAVNEFAVAGEFGFLRLEGPFEAEFEEAKWTIIIPEEFDHPSKRFLDDHIGLGAIVVADGKIVGGGLLQLVEDFEEEEDMFVVIDQYPQGNF